jgi:hypothetical protein
MSRQIRHNRVLQANASRGGKRSFRKLGKLAWENMGKPIVPREGVRGRMERKDIRRSFGLDAKMRREHPLYERRLYEGIVHTKDKAKNSSTFWIVALVGGYFTLLGGIGYCFLAANEAGNRKLEAEMERRIKKNEAKLDKLGEDAARGLIQIKKGVIRLELSLEKLEEEVCGKKKEHPLIRCEEDGESECR